MSNESWMVVGTWLMYVGTGLWLSQWLPVDAGLVLGVAGLLAVRRSLLGRWRPRWHRRRLRRR